MIGRVVSTKLKNTATVLVERIAMHPLYKKTFTRTKKYLVDDLIGVKDGDIVEIIKCKPISKNKHWKVTKVVGKNLAEIVEAEQKKKAAEVIAEVMPEEKVSENSENLRKPEDQNSGKSDSSDKSDTQSLSGKKKVSKKKETK